MLFMITAASAQMSQSDLCELPDQAVNDHLASKSRTRIADDPGVNAL